MLKAIAVDDEPVALDIIKNHAAKVPFLDLEATFLSATDALTYIKTNQVDLVFLDIAMPHLSGIEFAEMVNSKVQVVFVTAYPEHALKGFELAATDYLLKPVNFGRFLKACQLAESRINKNELLPVNHESLYVKDGHNWIQVKLSELLYAKGEDNYVSLYEKGKRVLTRMTMTDLQSKLPKNQFLRVHKSYIIALSKIEKIEKHQVTVGGDKVPLTLLTADELLGVING